MKRLDLPTLAALGFALCAIGVLVLPRAPTISARGGLPGGPPLPAVCVDADGDGYGRGCARGPDCNDRDPRIHPGAREVCNLRDDDCSGQVDDDPACVAPPLDPSRVGVPGGTFAMGCATGAADERPVHRVTVTGFSLDRHEVTNVRYRACVAAGACASQPLIASRLRPRYHVDPRFDDYPVILVDHAQATAFCAWAGGRLPTEAEWELAARGTADARPYPWGETLPDCTRANLGGAGSCVGDTDRVGRRPAGASPYGALDLAGNVWEWTADWYDPGYYRASPGVDPRGPAQGTLRVVRGGCFLSEADALRSTCRRAELPGTWAPNLGFRCAYGARPARR